MHNFNASYVKCNSDSGTCLINSLCNKLVRVIDLYTIALLFEWHWKLVQLYRVCEIWMNMECWWNDTEIGKTEVLIENPDSVPLCLSEMPHGLAWGQTWAPVTTGWQLTTWSMAKKKGGGVFTLTKVVWLSPLWILFIETCLPNEISHSLTMTVEDTMAHSSTGNSICMGSPSCQWEIHCSPVLVPVI